ncbi:hypothetical protein [Nostoc sp.]|uniref:hypothetical protein n=1 Tax=Nostoc sp. TaxID=1180 RepID=UPI002FF6C3EC
MKNEENLDTPHPDPAWDYYLTYHRLLKVKSQLNQLIKDISEFESATADSDQFINEDLFDLINSLKNTRIVIEPPDES